MRKLDRHEYKFIRDKIEGVVYCAAEHSWTEEDTEMCIDSLCEMIECLISGEEYDYNLDRSETL